MYFEEVGLEYVYCISVALNGGQWRTVLKTTIKHNILYKCGELQLAFVSYQKVMIKHNLFGISANVYKMSAKLHCLSRLCLSLICS